MFFVFKPSFIDYLKISQVKEENRPLPSLSERGGASFPMSEGFQRLPPLSVIRHLYRVVVVGELPFSPLFHHENLVARVSVCVFLRIKVEIK